MTFGIQSFDASGAPLWDSTTAGGGVVADLFDVGSGETPVKAYPAHAGRTCRVFCPAYFSPEGSAVDSALGYPRVTVAAGLPRQLMVVVW